MNHLYLFFFVYLAWRHIFQNKDFSGASLGVKTVHAVALIYVASICFNRLFGIWILLHPQKWIAYIYNGAEYYPRWIDISFQIAEAVISPVVLVYCFLVMGGLNKARCVLLYFLPIVFSFEIYRSVKVGLHHQSPHRISSIIILSIILGIVPWLSISAFYMHSFVIRSLFHKRVSS